jgi:hypothetical protein
MLRGKFIAISAYIKKAKTSQINNLMMHLKVLEKQEQNKPNTGRWKEIIKINEIKTKHTKQKVGSLKRLTKLTNS